MLFDEPAELFEALREGITLQRLEVVDLLLHGGVRERRPLDHVGIAEQMADERVQRGVLGVVVRR